MREIVTDLAGAVIPVACMELLRDEAGVPVVQPSGDRFCCSRTWGHYPRWPHAAPRDDGQLEEWR